MATTHTVEQGENLTRIAKQYGFQRYQPIWEHPENETLRRNRLSPDVLAPGDEVYIPDKKSQKIKLPTNQVHTLVVLSPPPQALRLRLENFLGQRWQGVPYELVVDDETYTGELGTHGELVCENLNPDASSAQLHLFLGSPDEASHVLALNLSELDPLETPSGIIARCNALGFYCGPVQDEITEQVQQGVKAFQASKGLTIDGDPGPQTQLDLEKDFGI